MSAETPDFQLSNSFFPGINAGKINAGEIMTEKDKVAILTEPNSMEHLVVEQRHRTLYHPVEYRGAASGSPYELRINEPLFAEYLKKEFGFSYTDFEKLRVYVIGEHEPKKPHGFTKEERKFFFDKEVYDPKNSWGAISEDVDGTQHIIFYAFNFWRDLNQERAAVIRFARTKKRTEKSWNKLDRATELLEKNKKHPKLGRRFTEYLANIGSGPGGIPVDRAERYINRFIYNYRAKNALKDHIAIHETSHSFHYKVSWDKLTKKLTDKLLNLFLETTAESEEIRMAKKPEWFGLIDFKVKEPQKIPQVIASAPRAA